MKRSQHRSRQRGVGLNEIMVSLVLGLLVVGAASAVFIATRQANRTSDGLSRLQESARTAFDLIMRDVREGGGTPCDSYMNFVNVLNAAQATPPTWWADWNRPVRGFGGADAFDGAAFGGGVGQRVAGTDAISVLFVDDLRGLAISAHDTGTSVFTVSRANPGIAVGQPLMACNYLRSALFAATAVNAAGATVTAAQAAGTNGNCTAGLALPTDCAATNNYSFPAGSKIGALQAVGWYIGNNGRADTGGRSLYRVTRTATEEIAEGVTAMTVTYLTSTGTDYVAPASITDWGRDAPAPIVGVRIQLTLQGGEANTSTATANTRVQRSFSFNVVLRNRAAWVAPA